MRFTDTPTSRVYCDWLLLSTSNSKETGSLTFNYLVESSQGGEEKLGTPTTVSDCLLDLFDQLL